MRAVLAISFVFGCRSALSYLALRAFPAPFECLFLSFISMIPTRGILTWRRGYPLPPNGSVRLANGRLTIMILGA
ncbi:conserved hypothetical protein [Ricinus communis]|uniref:Uncharacterized protein n=1 Tax=Ricinus communis TaxID=3988 RepID=B9TAB8_RICCO|nr:conserved hypothetical protein [Ricinus communis]